MSFQFDSGIFSIDGLSGEILPGASLAWHESGTSTPLATYSDPDLAIPNTNPVYASADGRLPVIWLQDKSYKLVVTLPDGTVITRDPIENPSSTLSREFASTSNFKGIGLAGWNVGADYAPQTAGEKLQQIPATADYSGQTAIEASTFKKFFAPETSSLPITGTMTKQFWGPGDLRLPGGNLPGDQGGAIQGFSFYYAAEDEGQQFALSSKAWTGTRFDRGSAPGQNHVVSFYAEAARGAGSSAGVWAINTVTNVTNLDGPTIGYEIDMNNLSGADPGLNPAQVFHALSLINGAAGRGGTGLVIDRNGDYSNNEWNRGIHIKSVLQRGIEFTNCGQAAGLFSDTTMAFKALTDTPIMRLTPFNNANLTDALLYLTNAANDLVVARWNKRGEIAIGGVGPQGMNGIGIRQINNGDNALFLQRLTDTSPTGTFLRAVNAANSNALFEVDFNAAAAETNVRLSVAGASAVRVSVGAADSAGSGFRALRVPN